MYLEASVIVAVCLFCVAIIIGVSGLNLSRKAEVALGIGFIFFTVVSAVLAIYRVVNSWEGIL